MSQTIRPVRKEDVPGILALISEIYGEYECVLDAENEDRHLLDPERYFGRSGGAFWVTVDEDRVIGTAGVLLHAGAGELKSLYVHRTARRTGLGRRLTEMAIEHARRAGKRRFVLWSDTRFRNAHRLYRKMGFSEFGLRILGDTNNSTEFGFERCIAPPAEEEGGG